jgi:hypothetical protein
VPPVSAGGFFFGGTRIQGYRPIRCCACGKGMPDFSLDPLICNREGKHIGGHARSNVLSLRFIA